MRSLPILVEFALIFVRPIILILLAFHCLSFLALPVLICPSSLYRFWSVLPHSIGSDLSFLTLPVLICPSSLYQFWSVLPHFTSSDLSFLALLGSHLSFLALLGSHLSFLTLPVLITPFGIFKLFLVNVELYKHQCYHWPQIVWRSKRFMISYQ